MKLFILVGPKFHTIKTFYYFLSLIFLNKRKILEKAVIPRPWWLCYHQTDNCIVSITAKTIGSNEMFIANFTCCGAMKIENYISKVI